MNCSSRTEDADRKAAFCRTCLRLPLAGDRPDRYDPRRVCEVLVSLD